MKHAVEMGSGVMLYIPHLIEISSGTEKLTGRNTHTDTQTAGRSHKPAFLFSFQNKEKRLNIFFKNVKGLN
jgi:hypothetical protein